MADDGLNITTLKMILDERLAAWQEVNREQHTALQSEVKRVGDKLEQQNGYVRDLCAWQAQAKEQISQTLQYVDSARARAEEAQTLANAARVRAEAAQTLADEAQTRASAAYNLAHAVHSEDKKEPAPVDKPAENSGDKTWKNVLALIGLGVGVLSALIAVILEIVKRFPVP